MALFALASAGCASSPSPAPRSPTPNPPLTPYRFLTPSLTPTESIPRPAATFTPLPTPTPFTYTIVEGDTLLSIAFRFSVTVDELVAVNPGIDSRLLSVGQQLVIPLGEEGVVLIPTPTPAPLQVANPDCYPAPDGGMWCFMRVENPRAVALEGVTGEISLYAADGEILASEVAYAPLDRLFARTALPLMAYFPPPAPRDLFVQGLVLAAFQVDPERVPALAAETSRIELSYAPDRKSVEVMGQVTPAAQDLVAPDGSLVVVVVGYAEGGEVVGLRKWEGAPGGQGQPAGFRTTVFSLGPDIAEVDVLAEYRPPTENIETPR